MKKSLFKNNIKEISKTRRRFISILIMAFLGVGFYAGLNATSPDMLESLDSYADSNNMYDIQVISTLGLTEDDVNAIKQIDGVDEVYGLQTKDALSKAEGKEKVCKIIEYNENINKPNISAGRMPETSNECLLDSRYTIEENVNDLIGKKIILENDDTNEDGSKILTQTEFTIVGIAETPIYISNERGNTSIGNGSIGYYIYTKDDVINLDYYTEICATVKNAKQYVTNSDEYLNTITPVKERIEAIKEEREQARYQELIDKANKKIAEMQAKYTQEKMNNIPNEMNLANENVVKIEKPTWYVQERADNLGYSNIFDAIKTMSNISKLFPIIFYLVAVLISLTSMTRMIEEERIEIGTLKSLGYTNFQIIIKYILYAFLACIIGGVLGMSIGFYLLPSIVWTLYSTMYTIPNFHLNYQLGIGLAGTFIAFACIGGATILVAKSELKETPAALMRPKAPKNGKKIFLEKIKFIWNKLNFSKKVTMRNIFRYKKRAIMTIVGIAGCTGLMLTGFGIRDSIIDIPNSQFKGIFKYDSSITLSNSDDISKIEKYMDENEKVESYSKICANTGKLKGSSRNYDATIFVPDSVEEFEKVCNLKDYKTGEKINLSDDGIVITDKVAEFIDAKVGDEITLIDGDNIEYHLKVSGIAQNYVSNYVYMTKNFYNANMKKFSINMILLKAIPNTSEEDLNKISEELLNIDGVASVSVISSLMSSISDMLGTLNYVVLILVIASALLDFVVLYNLANINIGERQREIATLKVLGFYDKEVDNYINKENLIFTVVGIILGLVFGYFLTDGVVASVEIDKLKFIRQVAPISYLYAAVITAIFSVIVNKVIHFVLKKIDMIESLKSVE